MDYRITVELAGLEFSEEETWEAVIAALERDRPEIGPVMSWSTPGATRVIVSLEADGTAHATDLAVHAISEALRRLDVRDVHPASIEVRDAATDRLIGAAVAG